MPTTDELGFELERRVVLFKSGTVMPDGSLLGYNADPNNASLGTTAGQTLIVNSPIGTLYIEDDGTMWRKTTLSTNTWVLMGSGSGSTGGSNSNTTEKHVLTRGAYEINMQAPSAVFIPMQENTFAADTWYDDINYIHAMVLPYDTTLKRVVMRATASASNKVIIGMHTNSGQPFGANLDYKFFPLTATETQQYTFANNNESRVFTFTGAASASGGSTLGISVSADGNIGMTNMSIVLEYDTA